MAIVRHTKTNVPYEYLGGNRYKNLTTNQEGEVSKEKAAEIFVVNLEATQIFNDYPLVKELVQKLNLKIDK